MGLRGAKVVDEGTAPDDTVDTNPPECHGTVYIAGVIEYAPTGFTTMGWRIVHTDDPGGVVQMVAQLPSIAAADEFIEAQTKVWKACEGKVVTNTDKASKQIVSSTLISAVRTGPHTVVAAQDDGPGSSCQHGQHVLQAVANIVLDVNACGGTVPNPAEAVAQQLAGKIRAAG